jgi:WXG100 family type VII secretion target
MATYSIATEDLHGASTQVANGATQIDSMLSQLRSTVDGTSAFWTGQAQAQMHQFYLQWDRAARDLHTALEGIAKTLNTNATQYQTTDDAVRSAWR